MSYAYVEVYEPPAGEPLDSGEDYHYLEGGPADADSGTTLLELTVDIPYDTDHAVYFWLDGETSAKSSPLIPAVSEWGLVVMTLLGLTAGTIMFMRRRPCYL